MLRFLAQRVSFFFGPSCAVACEGGMSMAVPWKGIMSISYEDATSLLELLHKTSFE